MLPLFLKSNFWFTEFDKLDLKQDKRLIIFQILNHGGSLDWQWLFDKYSQDEIKKCVEESIATAWFRQSLGLWQSVLGIKAKPNRFSDLPTPNLWPH